MKSRHFLSFEKVVTGGYSQGYLNMSLRSNSIKNKQVLALAYFVFGKIQRLNTNMNPNAFTLCELKTSLNSVGFQEYKSNFDYKMLSCFFIVRDKDTPEKECTKVWFKHNNSCLFGTDKKANRLEIIVTYTELRELGFTSLSLQQLRDLYVVLGVTLKNLSKFRPLPYSNKIGFRMVKNQPLTNLLRSFPVNTWFVNKNIQNTPLFALNKDTVYIYALNGYNSEDILPYLEIGLREFVQSLNNSTFEDSSLVNLTTFYVVRSLFPEVDIKSVDAELQFYRQILIDKLDVGVSKVLLHRGCAERFMRGDKKLDEEILAFFEETEQ